jgi:hypothetical protein
VIRLDQNLEHLTLDAAEGFTEEAGVVLAEALAVNKTLREVILYVDSFFSQVHTHIALGVQAYEAFSAMLRVNTSIVLKLPSYETAGADERLLDARKQVKIEQRLNRVGRERLLASKQTTRVEYIDALNELNNYNDKSPAFQVSCLYSLLRLNPSVVCMP